MRKSDCLRRMDRCSFFDYDGDGDQDLYFVNSGDLITGRGPWNNALYRNEGGTFVDVMTKPIRQEVPMVWVWSRQITTPTEMQIYI